MRTMRVLFEALEQRGFGHFVFMGDGARLTVSDHGRTYTLEELPAKGKRRLRVASMDTGYMPSGQERAWGAMIVQNVLRDAKLADGDDYDAMKRKLKTAINAAQDAVLAKWQGDYVPTWLKEKHSREWGEKDIPAGRVAPGGGDTPIQAEGKDFTVEVRWERFSVYSPDSDFQQSDPYYSGYGQKTPAAAAKLYKLLQENPNALKGVAYSGLRDWFTKNKIAITHLASTWS